MSLVDFIGFIIALVAMFFIFMKRVAEERRQRSLPEDEQGQTLDEFLRSMEEGEEPRRRAPPPPPPPPPKVKTRAMPGSDFKPRLEGYRQESAVEKRKLKTAVEERKLAPQKPTSVQAAEAYEVIQRKKSSRGLSVIKSMKHSRDMFILNELIGKPLSMRDPHSKDAPL